MYVIQIVKRFTLNRKFVVSTGAGEVRIPVKGNSHCPIIDMVAAVEHMRTVRILRMPASLLWKGD